jgi:hypothetical protein
MYIFKLQFTVIIYFFNKKFKILKNELLFILKFYL